MPSSTNVNLSPKEMQMVQVEEFILLKHSIMQKVNSLLTECIPSVESHIIQHFPEIIQRDVIQPKISKGEQYLQMPYMILDCPRIFSGQDVLAVRTMFLWGNFFSVTLQLSGKYLDFYRDKLINADKILPSTFFISIYKDPWQHHFGTNNYTPLHSMQEWKNFVQQTAFIKLAEKFNLEQWNEMHERLNKCYQHIGSLLH